MQLTESYWAWFGLINLGWMTAQDYYRGMKVDDRKNYFMYGMSFALLAIRPMPAWHLFIVLGIIIGGGWLLNKTKVFGRADINAIAWMVLGFTILGYETLITFTLAFCGCTLAYTLIKQYVYKINVPTAFFGILLISYALSCWMLGIF